MIGSPDDERMRMVDELMVRYGPMIDRRVASVEAVLRGRMIDGDDIRQQIRIKLWQWWDSFRRPNAVIHSLVWTACADVVRRERRQPITCGSSLVYGIPCWDEYDLGGDDDATIQC